MTLNVGDILRVPLLERAGVSVAAVEALVEYARLDWNSSETSDSFDSNPLVVESRGAGTLSAAYGRLRRDWLRAVDEVRQLEEGLNRAVIDAYDLDETLVPAKVSAEAVTLTCNPAYRYRDARKDAGAEEAALRADTVRDLISYAVGCMLGRYSPDEPGLVLADQGAILQDYVARIPSPTFPPDADNVIPIVDGDWFEDDVVGLFRKFIRTAFGEHHFEENLNFVTESLGVRTLRDYFISRAGKSKFYDDHAQRYKRRPIYWLFSSPKGSFNALIYMHRYTPSTVSTVLTYLREYLTKLESSLQQAERAGNTKEADRLRKILIELNEYEYDTLYPLASQNVVIDLDDGVKANYWKFGAALKKIMGLESASD